MNTKLSRSNFFKKTLLTGCLMGGVRSAISAETGMNESFANLDSLKKGIPWVLKWWEINFRGKLFVACLQQLPSYGQSNQNVHAWRKGADGSFELVWTYRMAGIGPVEVNIEEGKGIITVKAKAYTDMKDSVIALANLGGTVG